MIAGNLWNYIIKNTRKYLLYYLKGLIFNLVSELLYFSSTNILICKYLA